MVELRNYRADGEPFQNRLMVSPLRDASGSLVAFVGMQCEITYDRAGTGIGNEEVTEMLRAALDRVYDPLSVVTSMANLQSQAENALEAYRALASRVEGLSLLYDELTRPAMQGRSDEIVVLAGGYVSRVAAMLSALKGRSSLRVNVDADAVPMQAGDAAKLGLIASEAVANAFRHAFADHADGLVEIRLKRLGDDRLRLSVADDGIGLGKESWPREGKAGARIVRSFAAQLGGQLDVSSGQFGTTVTLGLRYDLATTGRGRRDGPRPARRQRR